MKNIHGIEPPERRHILRKKVVIIMICAIGFFGVVGYVVLQRSINDVTKQGSAIIAQSWNDLFSSPKTEGIVSAISIDGASDPNASSTSVSEQKISMPKTVRATTVSPQTKASSSSKGKVTESNTIPVSQAKENDDAVAVIENMPPSINQPSSVEANISSSEKNVEIEACSSSSMVVSSRRIILSEVAWMGSVSQTGEPATKAANREWIELKNISNGAIDLEGWQVVNASGKIRALFGSNDVIPAGGFLLMSRDNVSVGGISSDKAYSGTLANAGEKIFVFDPDCGLSDMLDASSGWPGGDNATKQTLERKSDFSWQTSLASGGTPRTENSSGKPIVTADAAISTEQYDVSVAIEGNSNGIVTMTPGGTICRLLCVGRYVSGTTVTLVSSASSGISFVGWSGGCSGQSKCSFVVGGPVSIIAFFRSITDNSFVENDVPSGETNMTSTTSVAITTSTDSLSDASSTPTINHLLIATIQIAGTESSNDFVKIYNPTSAAIDIDGWRLRKKSSTGTDASLREFPAGSSVAAGGYFVWATSANGFAESIGANASSTGTLAANNSVAIFDTNGTRIDAVAWGTGTGQYVEGAAYPDSPTANQVLQRKSANGVMVDTDNNENDFTL